MHLTNILYIWTYELTLKLKRNETIEKVFKLEGYNNNKEDFNPEADLKKHTARDI